MAKPTLYTPELIDYYVKTGYWKTITLSDIWEKNAQLYPDKEALVDSRHRLTWSQAKIWIDRLALGLLELGLRKDDVVVIQLPNCVELPLLRIACERAGLIHIPVVRVWRETEMGHVLQTSEAKAIVMPWKYRDFDYFKMIQGLQPGLPSLKHILIWGDSEAPGAGLIKDLVANPLEKKYSADFLETKKMPWNEYSLVAPTTGTTGLPKLVEEPVCAMLAGNSEVYGANMTGDDIVAATTNAAYGPNVPTYCYAPKWGAKVVMLEHWTVEAGLELIETEKITIMGVVPTQLVEINDYPHLRKYDLKSLRVMFSTGAALPYHLAVEVEEKLKCPILNIYGAMDFGGMSMSHITDSRETRLLTIGRPLHGNEVKIVDDEGKELSRGETGKIAFRGAKGASGYFRDPETTAKKWTSDGWYLTGDLGKMDKRGYLSIAGRSDDMIIRGGQNIMPAEIENLLLSHPMVKDAAVIGIPDTKMGEKACACIVAKDGQNFNFEKMLSFLKEKKIATYKLPEMLLIFESIPYVSGLKHDKKQLKQMVQQRLNKN